MVRCLLPLLLLAGCALDRSITDADGDGYATIVDCDDADPAVHPGAVEACDGVDQDCDGQVDEDAEDQRPFYPDRDGDGFGTPSGEPAWACTGPPKHADNADDCDDGDADVHPGAVEVCDGVDQDCDGQADEEVDDTRPWYADADGDGFGDLMVATFACGAGAWGYVRDASDCDDAGPWAASTFPGAAERESATACMQDADGDGWGDAAPADLAVTPGRDCDDVSPFSWQTFPGAAPLDSRTACMCDHDGDGFGEARPDDRRVAAGTDCDDHVVHVHPGSPERCDGVDQDCDGAVDEGVSLAVWRDADGDGFGDPAVAAEVCFWEAGWALEGGDCDDADPEVFPGAPEWCDGVDQDCDGVVDEEVVWADWYADADGDGWGVATDAVNDCLRPCGYAPAAGDCDDADPARSPGSAEIVCDGFDQDCDGDDGACVDLETAVVMRGADKFEYAGNSMAALGDPDGDGYDDVLIGVPFRNRSSTSLGERGAAFVVRGGPTFVDGRLEDVGEIMEGDAWYGRAGWSVGNAGDFNGDGVADLVVGAKSDSTAGDIAGMIHLVLGGGRPVISSLTDADAVFSGPAAGACAGSALAGVGDVDGDGLDDLLIGADQLSSVTLGPGGAFLVLGTRMPADRSLAAADAYLRGEAPGSATGWSVAGAGDTDGDGLADMLIGAPLAALPDERQGAAYLVLGGATPTTCSLSAAAVLLGRAGSMAGLSVAGVGDVDGDGLGDVLVGAPSDDSTGASCGAAYLILGTPGMPDRLLETAEAALFGEAMWDGAGSAVAGAGDLDGDGFADMLVGAEGADGGSISTSDEGRTYGILGGPSVAVGGRLVPDLVVAGGEGSRRSGETLAGAGDVDGDGLPDLLIGAPDEAHFGDHAGAVFLVFGGDLW